MMSLLNKFYESGSVTREELKTFILLLNPFAPHVTEELWEKMGYEGALNAAKWPEYDEAKCKESVVEIAVQVNGKIRARINVDAEIDSAAAIAAAKADPAVAKEIEGKPVIKELYVKGKLVNIVVKK